MSTAWAPSLRSPAASRSLSMAEVAQSPKRRAARTALRVCPINLSAPVVPGKGFLDSLKQVGEAGEYKQLTDVRLRSLHRKGKAVAPCVVGHVPEEMKTRRVEERHTIEIDRVMNAASDVVVSEPSHRLPAICSRPETDNVEPLAYPRAMPEPTPRATPAGALWSRVRGRRRTLLGPRRRAIALPNAPQPRPTYTTDIAVPRARPAPAEEPSTLA